MNNTDFWTSIRNVIDEGFTSEGLSKLDCYAEQFIDGRLIYKRFSPFEQHGCSEGGSTHVIASLLAGAEDQTDTDVKAVSDFKREFQQGEKQAQCIEHWAKKVGLWTDNVDKSLSNSFGNEIAEGGEAKVYDHGATLVKSIGLDYYILPILALDRISLHNAYFPETKLNVIGFGRDADNNFKIIVYYLIVPLTWTILFDVGIGLPIATPIVILVWLCVWFTKRKYFRSWCDVAFDASVKFLLSFKHVGWNYEKASVIICVIVPIIIYVLLILWAVVL